MNEWEKKNRNERKKTKRRKVEKEMNYKKDE